MKQYVMKHIYEQKPINIVMSLMTLKKMKFANE